MIRQNRKCVTLVLGLSSRSISSSRRLASRERWSSSALGTLWLHRFVLDTAPSIDAERSKTVAARSRAQCRVADSRGCVSYFTHRRQFLDDGVRANLVQLLPGAIRAAWVSVTSRLRAQRGASHIEFGNGRPSVSSAQRERLKMN